MLDIKIGGRRVRPNQIARELEKEVVKRLKKEIPKNVRDPKTGQRMPVRVTGANLKNLKLKGV